MFLDDNKSCNQIAMAFNAEKIPTSGRFKNSKHKRFIHYGSFWTGEAIRGILKNRFYIGRIVDGQEVIPSLITEEKWNAVQKEMTRRSKNGGTTKKLFLLRRLLHCGRCGSGLCVVDTIQKRMTRPEYHYSKYVCGCRNLENVYEPYVEECDLPPVQIQRMDELVWNRVSMTLLSDDKLKNAILSKENRSDIPSLEKKMFELRSEIKRFEQAKSDLLGFIASGYWTKTEIDLKVSEVQADIVRAQSEIKLIQDRLNGEHELGRFLNKIRIITERLRRGLHEYTVEQKRELLLAVVEKVTVDYDAEDRQVIDPDSLNIKIELKINIQRLSELLRIPSLTEGEFQKLNDKCVLLSGQGMSPHFAVKSEKMSEKQRHIPQ
jgi:hypothetical protein